MGCRFGASDVLCSRVQTLMRSFKPRLSRREEGVLAWAFEKNGSFRCGQRIICLLKNILWPRDNLRRRHTEEDGTCQVCGAQPETVFHAVTECTYAKIFWDVMKKLNGIKLPALHPDSWRLRRKFFSYHLQDIVCSLVGPE